MDKLDMVLAGLRPAALDRLAEDGYTRNRHADLAMMAAGRHLAPGARGGPVSTRRRRWPVLQ